MATLICCDRDGTINEDDDYYLGRHADWAQSAKIIDGVVDGIRLLNQIPSTHIFVVTQQSGVAILEYPALTEKRVDEVNTHILRMLRSKGAQIDGCHSCYYVDNQYVRRKCADFTFDPRYVKSDHPCIKPNPGLVEQAARSIGLDLLAVDALFVIGDRYEDVMLGINAGGVGILVPSKKTLQRGDVRRVERLSQARSGFARIAGSFIEASQFIWKFCMSSESGF